MKSSKDAQVHLIISGEVQGVFFRASAQEKARALGLTGWVKNRKDGRVELVAQGDEDTLDELVNWCHHGPEDAFVQLVEMEWTDIEQEFEDFEVRA